MPAPLVCTTLVSLCSLDEDACPDILAFTYRALSFFPFFLLVDMGCERSRDGSFITRCTVSLMATLLALQLELVLARAEDAQACEFQAIYNFGDSSSDTGSVHAALPFMMQSEQFPYGRTFFQKAANRYSDGRLLIDFLAQGLGKPFLSPYLQAVDSNFSYGANFASSGATARNIMSPTSPFNLQIQVNQFKAFKEQVSLVHQQKGPQNYLPSMDSFPKALYILQLGGSDFSHAYTTLRLSPQQIKTHLPSVVSSVSNGVKELYESGARLFWVMDVGPQGCLPFTLSKHSHAEADHDMHGCARAYNEAVILYNHLLKAQLKLLQEQLPAATIVYVNTYDVVYTMIGNAQRYGFEYATRACCGVGGDYNYNINVQCGTSNNIHWQYLTALSCIDPSMYINWDGVHLTDQANRVLARHILRGDYFHPSFPLSTLCPAHLFSV